MVPDAKPKYRRDGYHPISCFSKEFMQQKLDYLHNNPVKAGFVREPQHYVLSSAVDHYEQRKGKIDIMLLEEDIYGLQIHNS